MFAAQVGRVGHRRTLAARHPPWPPRVLWSPRQGERVHIVMTRQRVWLDAGVERLLDIGTSHDMPDVVATSLIATGAARRADDLLVALDGEADVVPPERKPMRPPERKG